MLVYSEVFFQGYNGLIEEAKKEASSMMDIGILKLAKGSSFSILENDKEMALLLLTGHVIFGWNGQKKEAARANLHDEAPSCLHVSKDTGVVITAIEETEIYVQKTLNCRNFEPLFYDPMSIQSSSAGTGNVLQGCMRRNIRTVFDYDNAPYSNMVLGEVINFSGRWSSYPPHYHPQPEVYFFKFDHPQGFGASFIGDKVFVIKHNSLALIPGNVGHPQVSAPGYAMYYVWGIRHLDGEPWLKTRVVEKEHKWLMEPDVSIWADKI